MLLRSSYLKNAYVLSSGAARRGGLQRKNGWGPKTCNLNSVSGISIEPNYHTLSPFFGARPFKKTISTTKDQFGNAVAGGEVRAGGWPMGGWDRCHVTGGDQSAAAGDPSPLLVVSLSRHVPTYMPSIQVRKRKQLFCYLLWFLSGAQSARLIVCHAVRTQSRRRPVLYLWRTAATAAAAENDEE